MTFITVRCLHCHSEQIVKRGKTRRGTQRYLCQNTACTTGSFLLDYRNRGCLPEGKQTIVAQFIAVCRRSKWSKHLTNSPFLAPRAIEGSRAAYKIISACSQALC